ncbi:MAG: MATE family efflux transporter [Reyranellaceae bacterium]
MTERAAASPPVAAPVAAKPTIEQAILAGPILPTILRLAAPNVFTVSVQTAVAVVETWYVGQTGIASLAALALVFPMLMLLQTTSAGAMGGGVSSSIARALGGGEMAKAQALIAHAMVIALAAGAVFSLVFLGLGPALYRLLGGEGEVLGRALTYSNILFAGAILVWQQNTLVSVVRGTGNMGLPTVALVGGALVQMVLGGALTLGWFGLPALGIAGIGWGMVGGAGFGIAVTVAHLLGARARVRLRFAGVALQWRLFKDILSVGAIASLSSLQTVLTVVVLSGLVARYGTTALAGYGIGARLEFLQIPLVFGIGAALVPMVGMNYGAGNGARAKRVAWIGAAAAGGITGAIGIIVAVFPGLWAGMFTSDAAVLATAYDYLRIAGPCYGFFGLGLALYFASQGSRKVLGPVLAGTLRLVVVVIGGLLIAGAQVHVTWLFAIVGAAMLAYAAFAAAAVALTRWTR